jgi:hypothetical protein
MNYKNIFRKVFFYSFFAITWLFIQMAGNQTTCARFFSYQNGCSKKNWTIIHQKKKNFELYPRHAVAMVTDFQHKSSTLQCSEEQYHYNAKPLESHLKIVFIIISWFLNIEITRDHSWPLVWYTHKAWSCLKVHTSDQEWSRMISVFKNHEIIIKCIILLINLYRCRWMFQRIGQLWQ